MTAGPDCLDRKPGERGGRGVLIEGTHAEEAAVCAQSVSRTAVEAGTDRVTSLSCCR